MSPLKSNRLAWSVAVAALALWATSAPVTWGQVAAGATNLIAQTTDDGVNANTTTVDVQAGDTTITTNDSGAPGAPCATPVLPPSIAPAIPPTPVTSVAAGGQPGTFHVCGADPALETAIQQLIGGRGFSATLESHGEGCADLTIRPTSDVASGTASSNLSVSLGSGRNLSIQIMSAQGVTHANVTVR
jgi:hypothetical protein